MSQFLSYAKVESVAINELNQNLQITIGFKDLFDLGLLPELQAILGSEKGIKEFEFLVDFYLSSLTQRLHEIRFASDIQDWKTLHRLFHNFKASSSYVGGRYLAWLSENLAQMITAELNQTERFNTKFESFYLEVHRLKQHLESKLG